MNPLDNRKDIDHDTQDCECNQSRGILFRIISDNAGCQIDDQRDDSDDRR